MPARVKNPKVLVDQLPLFAPPVPTLSADPSTWPDFHGSDYVGFDTETYDPGLVNRGPGFIRGDAEVIGVSLADESGRKIYLPIGHVEGNFDRDQVLRYVRHQLRREDQKKCGANLHYDMEALWSLGVDVHGPLCDVQIAEPILDEEREGGYTLEALSASYLGEGKTETLLRQAAADYRLDPKKHMKYLPAGYVAEYAADDAAKPVFIFMEQEEALKADDVWDIFTNVEQPLQRVLFKMRLRGVRVDLDAAERLAAEARQKEQELYSAIREDCGFAINVNAPAQLGRYFVSKGLDVPRTAPTKNFPDGNLSVTDEWLKFVAEDKDVKAATLVRDYRACVKMRKDFIEGMVLNRSVRGRVHSQWNQLRRSKDEDGGGDETQGTRSGRIAAANENLTQIPVRHPYWGKRIRSLYLPEVGGEWCKMDYPSQEPRLMLHFAYIMGLEGAAEARARYISDPDINYHKMTAQLILERSGKDIGYRPAKDINLGRAYGMGVPKLARRLKVPEDVAREILEVYDAGVPYVKKINRACMDRVRDRGYIVTIEGRKRRFNMWEKKGSGGYGSPPTDYESAVRLYGRYNVERAGLSKALNSLVQGSAGDQTKKSLVMMDEAGLEPLLQVYDEIGMSFHSRSQVQLVKDIMETAVRITIPINVVPETGPSWGQLVEDESFGYEPRYLDRTS